LLAHEYLAIFEKPKEKPLEINEEPSGYGHLKHCVIKPLLKKKLENMETTTVWMFPEKDHERLLNKNVIERYSDGNGYKAIDITCTDERKGTTSYKKTLKDLLFIKATGLDSQIYFSQSVNLYLGQLKSVLHRELPFIKGDGYIVIQTKDIRIGEYIEPLAKRIVDSICFPELILKEIVVTAENQRNTHKEETSNLHISHQYLLIYKKSEHREI